MRSLEGFLVAGEGRGPQIEVVSLAGQLGEVGGQGFLRFGELGDVASELFAVGVELLATRCAHGLAFFEGLGASPRLRFPPRRIRRSAY